MIEQIQIYTSLLQLLDYQLKELLKLHIETREIFNNAINTSISLTEVLDNQELPIDIPVYQEEIISENTQDLVQDLAQDLVQDLAQDLVKDPEHIQVQVKLNEIDSEDENDDVLEKKKLITMDPFMEKTGCFMRKPKCVAPKCMYDIMPNTIEDRQRRYKEELEEVVKKKVDGIHKKKITTIEKPFKNEKNCTIM